MRSWAEFLFWLVCAVAAILTCCVVCLSSESLRGLAMVEGQPSCIVTLARPIVKIVLFLAMGWLHIQLFLLWR